ncbi:uncharacterized protein C8R40DRAFT_1068287 [Lentinula edodes]|uniref:uncharacterized protein n=1 Tax=Lentinula edodes TaxID=5353 RepID=UPI001E8EB34B|nr:uncharacterized protein C8R40DRAFT_1068287 [Lentinula edodes]KAH7877082.1 hypothetical protein C8R40DRAFT_1068287 [Lentinula edodes]
MVYSRSVLTAVVAIGVASSALAVPLPSSDALGRTVSVSGTVIAPTVDARELELSVFEDDEWHPHPLERLGVEDHIDEDPTPFLSNENPQLKTDIQTLVGVATASEHLADIITDDHRILAHSDPMSVLPKAEEKSLSLSFDMVGPAPGFSPVHMERRNTMTDEEAKSYLEKLEYQVRWTQFLWFRNIPMRAENLENSNDWADFEQKPGVKEFIDRTTTQRNLPDFPKFVEAYFACVKNKLLPWCSA